MVWAAAVPGLGFAGCWREVHTNSRERLARDQQPARRERRKEERSFRVQCLIRARWEGSSPLLTSQWKPGGVCSRNIEVCRAGRFSDWFSKESIIHHHFSMTMPSQHSSWALSIFPSKVWSVIPSFPQLLVSFVLDAGKKKEPASLLCFLGCSLWFCLISTSQCLFPPQALKQAHRALLPRLLLVNATELSK